jgi:hypothetical protein
LKPVVAAVALEEGSGVGEAEGASVGFIEGAEGSNDGIAVGEGVGGAQEGRSGLRKNAKLTGRLNKQLLKQEKLFPTTLILVVFRLQSA